MIHILFYYVRKSCQSKDVHCLHWKCKKRIFKSRQYNRMNEKTFSFFISMNKKSYAKKKYNYLNNCFLSFRHNMAIIWRWEIIRVMIKRNVFWKSRRSKYGISLNLLKYREIPRSVGHSGDSAKLYQSLYIFLILSLENLASWIPYGSAGFVIKCYIKICQWATYVSWGIRFYA